MTTFLDERTLAAHILVVDDAQNTRQAIAALLASEGYTVSTAQDGFDALEQLQRQTFDLIISDLRMPRMSGIEFLKAVRHRFPNMALILASGDYEDYGALEGRIADAFYVKGSHPPQELLHTVAKVIGGSPRSLSF